MLQSKTGELELSRSVEWDVSGLRHCPARAAVRPNAEGNSIDKLMVENMRRTLFSTGVDVAVSNAAFDVATSSGDGQPASSTLMSNLADSIRKNDGRESPARFVVRVYGDGFRDNRNALAVEEMGSRGRAALIMGLAS